VHLLHALGYCLTKTTSCGASALELAQDFRPSIVLIALDLPDMSGRYLARRLRGRAGAGQLRLIALAADYSLAGRDLARESGFLHHLSKPVGPAALQRVLRAKLV
jgi:CheY-like chemotaxis protein